MRAHVRRRRSQVTRQIDMFGHRSLSSSCEPPRTRGWRVPRPGASSHHELYHPQNHQAKKKMMSRSRPGDLRATPASRRSVPRAGDRAQWETTTMRSRSTASFPRPRAGARGVGSRVLDRIGGPSTDIAALELNDRRRRYVHPRRPPPTCRGAGRHRLRHLVISPGSPSALGRPPTPNSHAPYPAIVAIDEPRSR